MSEYTLYNSTTERYVKLVDARLMQCLSDENIPKLLRESMQYSLFPSGKRLRPCICLAAAEMLGGSAENALPFAAALEMIHTYSLIHDDLPCMDDDDYRRGRLSNHKVYGEANAVLAGDGLLSLAFESMLSSGEMSGQISAMRAVAHGAGTCGMVAGQSADIMNEGSGDASFETLRYIHERKTGALIKAAGLAGVYSAKGSADDISAIESFCEKYGVLFQVTDDILDVTGDSATVGKTLGKDSEQHKLTYPALFGLERSREIVKSLADEAKAELSRFKEKAQYLCALVELTVGRDK